MNIDNGHLVTREALKRNATEYRGEYRPVPVALQSHARRALKGREETTVNLRGNSALAKWAREKRRKRQAAAKQARKAARP